jgi:hypothetical protein
MSAARGQQAPAPSTSSPSAKPASWQCLIVTTLAIAKGTGNEHKTVIQLVRTYQSDLEEFGLVAFVARPRPAGKHGGSDVEFAIRNELQATLIMTYMKDSEVGEAELRHDNLMAKVPKVLGGMSPKFLGVVEKPMPKGGVKELPIYTHPKREA